MPAWAKLVGEELPELNQLRKLPNPMKNMEVLCKENPWETWEQNIWEHPPSDDYQWRFIAGKIHQKMSIFPFGHL